MGKERIRRLLRKATPGESQIESATSAQRATDKARVKTATITAAGLLTIDAINKMSPAERKKRLAEEEAKNTKQSEINALRLKNKLLEMDKIVAKAIIDNPDKPESKLAPKTSTPPPSRPRPKMSKGGLIDMRKTGMFR